jgi:antitoxin (DNA-binding transcriptional repressor) of toxin-antitoxin stability system
MSEAVPIKNAERNLEELLKGLPFGESITLTGPEGSPVAILVSLKSAKSEQKPFQIGMLDLMTWPKE